MGWLRRWVARSRWRVVGIALVAVGAGLYLLAPSLPKPLFPARYSGVVIDRDGHMLRAFRAKDGQWRLRPTAETPDKLAKAVVAFEDRRFYRHPGVDVLAIGRALSSRVTGRGAKSGASTITMQVARLALPKERHLWSKFVEVFHALALERRYTKRELLRLWLDHTPFGGNLVGIDAAAWRYFRARPEELSWAQTAFLAVLPKSPNLVQTEQGQRVLLARRNLLLARLAKEGALTKEELALSRAEPLTKGTFDFPFRAPHLTSELHRRFGDVPVRTTIDAAMQNQAESIVGRHAMRLRTIGIPNAAALIADTKSGEVLAYVGSQDFSDSATQGQVDGVRAARSSGSILKPFLYALAMDRGLVVSESVLVDVLTHFNAFTPANYENHYDGLLRVRDALAQSSNVPAVRLLAEVGVYDFYSLLKNAGVSTLFRPSGDYGLTLVLGGAEVTLWDLAGLYRGLGRGGLFGPLHVVQSEKPNSQRLLTRGSSYLVTEILEDVRRPGAEHYWKNYVGGRPVAWKTGTSYGQRDGWAVGVTPEYVIAVWVGDFRGFGNPSITGTGAAAPLLFELYAAIAGEGAAWFEAVQEDLAPVQLCAVSGYLATEHCPHSTAGVAPKGARPLQRCPFHASYEMEGKDEVCSKCWTPGHHHREVRLVYPPDVNAFLRKHGQSPSEPPKHRASCPVAASDAPLRLLYPSAEAVIMVPRNDDGTHAAIALRAAHSRSGATLHWYLDSSYLGATKGEHTRAVFLSPGKHVVEIIDESGSRARVAFQALWRAE